MARMQRWRRSRSAGEGATPVADAQEMYDFVMSSHVAQVADGEPSEHDPLGPDAEPDLDLNSAPPDLEATPETSEAEIPEPEVPDADDLDVDDREVDEPRRERPELPHVPERSGVGAWILGGRDSGDYLPLALLQAAHAKQAIGTALVVGLVAVVSGRPAREVGVVLLTVLVGQTILGWHNDVVDRQRDQAHGLTNKPLATGRVDPGAVWYAIVVAALVLVPLSIMTGIRAGCLYLAAVAIGMLGNVLLRTGVLSWWSWAISFALIPAYLSYGGWGGQAVGSDPEPAIVALAAALGVGVHFMRAVWGLVADHEDGWTYLPLRLGLKLGATRLLAVSTLYTAAIVIALVVVGAQVGLSR